MLLIDDILLAPMKGMVWLGEKIKEVADQELSDEGRIKERVMALQLKFELDEISEEEYNGQEKELLVRLEEIRKYKEEQAKQGR